MTNKWFYICLGSCLEIWSCNVIGTILNHPIFQPLGVIVHHAKQICTPQNLLGLSISGFTTSNGLRSNKAMNAMSLDLIKKIRTYNFKISIFSLIWCIPLCGWFNHLIPASEVTHRCRWLLPFPASHCHPRFLPASSRPRTSRTTPE